METKFIFGVIILTSNHHFYCSVGLCLKAKDLKFSPSNTTTVQSLKLPHINSHYMSCLLTCKYSSF